ncbi:DUF881 domain-containing protein [Frankia sp. Ag45/Mut15]|uniref:DUF881 domain-containing protein n=2 Tax=Frankia TaxID=1854 RepID=A0ABT0JX51_9ACTN|nr:DUF881 domain-containing protein [Frankia umida]MCK9875995.1 DUF881 domain-containing protein [Frankia umida]
MKRPARSTSAQDPHLEATPDAKPPSDASAHTSDAEAGNQPEGQTADVAQEVPRTQPETVTEDRAGRVAADRPESVAAAASVVEDAARTDRGAGQPSGPPEPSGEPGESPLGERAERGARARRGLRVMTLLLLAGLGFGGVIAVRSAAPSFSVAQAGPDQLAATLRGIGAADRSLVAQEGRLRQVAGLLPGAAPTAGQPGPPAPSVAPASASATPGPDDADEVAVLAGTVPVTGPGLELTIRDPKGSVDASVLLDALQELRDAGAEAIEIAGVRVGVSTYVADHPGLGLVVDGRSITAPYVLRVIGDAHTLDRALRIPGGVLDTVAAREGAQTGVRTFVRMEIRTVRPTPSARYARPAG